MVSVKIPPIGTFRSQLVAQKLTVTQNNSGGFDEDWTDIYMTFAFLRTAQSARDFFMLQNIQGTVYEVFIRSAKSKEVSKDVRFKYDNQIWIVRHIERLKANNQFFWRLLVSSQT